MIFIASILTLGLSGVSYAYWTNGLDINGNIGTGSLDVVFNDQGSGNKAVSENGGLQVTLDQDKTTMYVEGTVDPGYVGTVEYQFTNNGNIPVKFAQASSDSDAVKNELSFPGEQVISLGNGAYVVKENGAGNGKLQIDIGETADSEVGSSTSYEFEIRIPFEQWTSN